MLITKTPFRISFCGGGSDMEKFYKEHGGCVLSTTINKYMYISIHPYFNSELTALKYSQNEIVDDISKIDHSILRVVLNEMKIKGVEIVSTADVPSGTGLGSSSSFTVGLLHALYCYRSKYVSKAKLAAKACEVEIDKLGAPIGKQDQYAAAFGGMNFIEFNKDDTVTVSPIIMKKEKKRELEDNLIMFYTGFTRDANIILKEQRTNLSQRDKANNLKMMCSLTQQMKNSLENNNLSNFGEILNEGWIRKRELASGIANKEIDYLYDLALKNGANGGKLLGAGGGGFLLFYCEKGQQDKLEKALGLKRFDFKFEHDGASVIYVGDKYW